MSSFYQPGSPQPPGTTAHPGSAGNYAVGADLTVSVAGVQAAGIYFYKNAGDTTASRGAKIYKTSDQSVVASATFSGESASGWQYVAFGAPVALSTGVTYRVAVNVGPSYNYYSGYTNSGTALTGAQLGGGSYVGSASLIYPSNADPTDYYGLDVELTGLAAVTSLIASQGLAEAWQGASLPTLIASQLMAEVFAQQTPPTAMNASQLFGELWSTNTPIAVVASQVLAEAWTKLPPPAPPGPTLRVQVQAQVL